MSDLGSKRGQGACVRFVIDKRDSPRYRPPMEDQGHNPAWRRPAADLALGLFLLGLAGLFLTGGSAQDKSWGAGRWDSESGLGHHRAVVRVERPAPPNTPAGGKASPKTLAGLRPGKPAAVRVVIPWRRRDLEPWKKNVIVVDAATGERIMNMLVLAVNRESGDIVFEPKSGPGDYDVYFMPYKSEGRKNYPNVKYDPPQATADPAWLAANGLSPEKLAALRPDDLARAEVVELQADDEFDAFTPMELIATAGETGKLLAAHPGSPYLLFPEDRALSIRMNDFLPARWAAGGPGGVIRGQAARGEYFTFQIGVWAARAPITDVDVRFSDLVRPAAKIDGGASAAQVLVPAKQMTCFNKGGVGWGGSAFSKAVPVDQGKVQALWCGFQVPASVAPGLFKGTVTVAPDGLPETILALELDVTNETLADAGDSDPSRMSRLRWLDS
ncbi:MAG: glycoside hydrolase domain-containing protein, partial [Candidatus Aminicenantales bacterium]